MDRNRLGIATTPDLPSESEIASHDVTRVGAPLGVVAFHPHDACGHGADGTAEGGEELAPVDVLIARLAAEMAAAWRRGEYLPVEVLLARYPELLDRPEAGIRLVFEEVCLRREVGREVPTAEFAGRFPQWSSALAALIGVSSSSDVSGLAPTLPEVGEVMGGFRLLKLLGRGVRGCVFLASQASLADRPVVLKISPLDDQEHLSLARLRHPHIVPLYGVQDVPERGLRVLCMPYLGGATLARLLDLLAATPVSRRIGRDLVELLDQVQAEAPMPAPAPGPARRFLARASYTQAACWIAACLADVLRDAHARDLLHLDVKPSNVLLAADGTPMLLDFHLAQSPIGPGEPSPRRVGGTPPYMPPEQRTALAEARSGQGVRAAVDGRCDLYALGVLLLQMLGGTPPSDPKPITPRQIRRQTGIGVGLSDILARCLQPDPRDRYPDAGRLADDLRRHLADRPLRGVANRSPAELWRKWSRRHPLAHVRAGAAATAAAAILAVLLAVLGDVRRRVSGAEAALAEGRQYLRDQSYPGAARALARGLVLTDKPFPLAGCLTRVQVVRQALGEQLRLAQRHQKVRDLHDVAERLRLLHGAALPTSNATAALEPRLRAVWETRGEVLGPSGDSDDADTREQLRVDLLDLGILWADLRIRLAAGDMARAEAHRAALATLAEAEASFGSSLVLERERRSHAEALGLADLARESARRVSEQSPATPWEHYALGRSFFEEGDLASAFAEFERAIDLRPHDLWPHFCRGICAYRLEEYEAAVGSFDTCIALAPGLAECYYNRGRARAALGQDGPALRDFDRALQLDPSLASAALDRGVLHYRENRYPAAIDDFRRALTGGADPATVHHDLALAHLAQGDRVAALEDLRLALRHDPRREDARALERRIKAELDHADRPADAHRADQGPVAPRAKALASTMDHNPG